MDWIDQTREIIAGLRANEPIFQNRTSSPDRCIDGDNMALPNIVQYTHTHIRVIVIVEIIICCFFCFGAKRQSLRVLLSRYFAKNLASCMCAQRARLKLDHREKLIIFFFWFSFHFTLGSARHVMAESPPTITKWQITVRPPPPAYLDLVSSSYI